MKMERSIVMRQKLEEIKNSAINELKTALSKDELET